MDKVLTLLKSCPLLRGLDDDGRARLAPLARQTTYASGQVVFRQDQPCPGVYVVDTGLVRLYKLAPSGKEHVLHLASPGMSFAEVAAIGGFPTPANAEAVVDTACLLFPTAEFGELLRTDHEFCRRMLVGMSFWVRHLVDLMEDLVLRDAAGRLARFLLDTSAAQGPELELTGLKKHVASHLGLTSETLSRTLRRLAQHDLIAIDARRAIRIVDADGLRNLADGAV